MNTARKLPLITDDDITALYSQVLNQCFRHLRNFHDAEDATQNTMISACRKKSQFKGESKLSCWLFQIAYNECNMIIRYNNAKKRQPLFQPSTFDLSNISPPNYPDVFFINQLQKAFNQLPPRQKEALIARQFLNIETGRTLYSLKGDLHRARKPFLELVKC